jgi:hypothetical protein
MVRAFTAVRVALTYTALQILMITGIADEPVAKVAKMRCRGKSAPPGFAIERRAFATPRTTCTGRSNIAWTNAECATVAGWHRPAARSPQTHSLRPGEMSSRTIVYRCRCTQPVL